MPITHNIFRRRAVRILHEITDNRVDNDTMLKLVDAIISATKQELEWAQEELEEADAQMHNEAYNDAMRAEKDW